MFLRSVGALSHDLLFPLPFSYQSRPTSPTRGCFVFSSLFLSFPFLTFNLEVETFLSIFAFALYKCLVFLAYFTPSPRASNFDENFNSRLPGLAYQTKKSRLTTLFRGITLHHIPLLVLEEEQVVSSCLAGLIVCSLPNVPSSARRIESFRNFSDCDILAGSESKKYRKQKKTPAPA